MKRFIYIPTFLFQFLFLNDARNFLFTLKKSTLETFSGVFCWFCGKEKTKKNQLCWKMFLRRGSCKFPRKMEIFLSTRFHLNRHSNWNNFRSLHNPYRWFEHARLGLLEPSDPTRLWSESQWGCPRETDYPARCCSARIASNVGHWPRL